MSTERTLWIWSTLPKQPLVAEDQSWRNEGDAVENVHRIQMSEFLSTIFLVEKQLQITSYYK